MTWVVAWLTGSKLGRYAALALAVVAALSVALVKAFLSGEAKERAKQQKASLDALRSRVKTDDEIARLPLDQRRARLERWM